MVKLPTMVRVLLVDDHSAFARSLQLVLEKSSGLEVAAVVAGTLAEGRDIV
jgi:CheY-like chemotaxis protein